jgi:hypothetical protein
MTAPLESKFRYLLPTDSQSVQADYQTDIGALVAPSTPEPLLDSNFPYHFLKGSMLPPTSPPLTPHLQDRSDARNICERPSEGQIPAQSPVVPLPIPPQSPYDPLQTPSFRHSPPRLPSDQPWRFPSPSHPLHSRAQDISLAMLAPIAASPLPKSLPTVLDASPAPVNLGGLSTIIFGQSDSKFCDNTTKTAQPSPRTFAKDQGHIAFTDRINAERNPHHYTESPLSRSSRATVSIDRKHKSWTPSKLHDDWLSDSELSSADFGTRGIFSDPFDIYPCWDNLDSEKESLLNIASLHSCLGTESPVQRSGALTSVFSSSGEPDLGHATTFSLTGDDDEDNDYMLMYPPLAEEEGDEAEVAQVLTTSGSYLSMEPEPMSWHEASRAPKKRRIVGPH